MIVESELYSLKESPKDLQNNSKHLEITGNAKEWIKAIERNVVIPAFILRRLAGHTNPDLRTALADNRNSPPDLLMFLTDDTNADVRYAMAENHNNSMVVLQKLAKDLNPYVSSRAEKTMARLSFTR